MTEPKQAQTIGQVTRAKWQEDDHDWADEHWEEVGLAAVKHALAQLEQSGYKLVPREPTEEMMEAWRRTVLENEWPAMYDAASAVDVEKLLKRDG